MTQRIDTADILGEELLVLGSINGILTNGRVNFDRGIFGFL